MLDVLKFANAGVSFLLELCMLAAFGYWGFHGEKSLLVKWLLGLGTPLIVACVWGIWLAPQAQSRLSSPWGTVLALILFGLATLALGNAGHPTLALLFGAMVIINEVLLILWHQW